MKKLLIMSCVILILLVGCVAGFYVWGIKAKNTSEELVSFIIEPGTTKTEIAKNLENAGLIRSQYALDIYLFFEKANIQAGEYELRCKDSVCDSNLIRRTKNYRLCGDSG